MPITTILLELKITKTSSDLDIRDHTAFNTTSTAINNISMVYQIWTSGIIQPVNTRSTAIKNIFHGVPDLDQHLQNINQTEPESQNKALQQNSSSWNKDTTCIKLIVCVIASMLYTSKVIYGSSFLITSIPSDIHNENLVLSDYKDHIHVVFLLYGYSDEMSNWLSV